jgi:hypothetical protein
MRILIFITCLASINLGFSQTVSNFNTSKNWSLNKHEIFFALGATQFLGDLGGLNKTGSNNSVRDIDWPSTRMGGGFGYRYRFHPRFATSSRIYVGQLKGDDAYTDEIIRRSRNLSFRSIIVELSQRIEFIILANEKRGSRYNIRGLKGFRSKADLLYVFSGIAGFYFNSQTEINGKWTDLRPLKTEGQGFKNGAEEYSRFSFGIPFGIGFKLGIGNFWRIGLEVSYNKTFTDYIDDVSTDYFDPAVLKNQVGQDAVYAANPAIENHGWFVEGTQRGNPNDNDAYFLANIVLTRNITYPKPKRNRRIKWKGRTKF